MAEGDAAVTKKTKDIDIAHGSNRPFPTLRAPADCVVLKVLVKDGMEVEKDQPMFLLELLNISHILPMQTMPEWKKAKAKKLMDLHSLRVANIPMEDVLLNHNACAENSAMAALDRVDVLKRYENFKKFDTLVDHYDHLFSAQSHAMERPRKEWVDKIHEEWRVLEEHLPDTIFVRVYDSRLVLLKAVIVGPEGTPYHNGLFFFVCPHHRPLLILPNKSLHTHIPNLISSCGILRLSLPKTNGDLEHLWVPGTSTLLQLLVSIQDLIFNSHPFFNGHITVGMRDSVDGERNDVASCIKPLVNAFYKIGAKEAQEFLYLSAKKTPVPAYEPPA
ncbi:ubiquitin-conjugating enzyme/RWD-like protein, partial [Tanacetum coccineum]